MLSTTRLREVQLDEFQLEMGNCCCSLTIACSLFWEPPMLPRSLLLLPSCMSAEDMTACSGQTAGGPVSLAGVCRENFASVRGRPELSWYNWACGRNGWSMCQCSKQRLSDKQVRKHTRGRDRKEQRGRNEKQVALEHMWTWAGALVTDGLSWCCHSGEWVVLSSILAS